MASTQTFKSWLSAEIQRQGIARRELARRLAAQRPEGVTPQTIETHRRAIYRYLDAERPMQPNDQTRRAFAEALGVDPADVPSGDGEEDVRDLSATLQAMAREQAEMNRRMQRLMRSVRNFTEVKA